MPNSQQTTVVSTVVATGTILPKRGVSRLAAQATANQPIIGFSDHKVEVDEALRLNEGPTSMAESGAAIDGTERRLIMDAQGRVIPWTTGGVVAALLQPGQTATAAGESIEVRPVVNQA